MNRLDRVKDGRHTDSTNALTGLLGTAFLLTILCGFPARSLFAAPSSSFATSGFSSKQEQILSDVSDAYRTLQKLYQNNHRKLSRLVRYREQGVGEDEISSLASEIKEDVFPKLNNVRDQLDALDPDHRWYRDIVSSAIKITGYYREYVRKILTDWTLSGSERRMAHRLPPDERLKQGYAPPKKLKQAFLGGLLSQMKRYGLMRDGFPWPELSGIDVISVYWRILSTYMDHLKQIHDEIRAQNKKERENGSSSSGGETPTEDDTDDGEADDTEGKLSLGVLKTDDFETETVRKQVETVRKKWTGFWKRQMDRWDKSRRKIERRLSLFRELRLRNSRQQQQFNHLLRLKKEYVRIQRFRKENIFGDPENIRSFLVMLSEFFLNSFPSLITDLRKQIMKKFRNLRMTVRRFKEVRDADHLERLQKQMVRRRESDSVFYISEDTMKKTRSKVQNIGKNEDLARLARLMKENYPAPESEMIKKASQEGETDQSNNDENETNAEHAENKETNEKLKHPYHEAIARIQNALQKLDQFTATLPATQKKLAELVMKLEFESPEEYRKDAEKKLEKVMKKANKKLSVSKKLWESARTLANRLTARTSEDQETGD